MKITAVRALCLRCACEPIHDALSTSRARQAVLVRVETDSGLFGIGEAFTYGAPLSVMRFMVEEKYGPMLLGQDPDAIDELWQMMNWRTIASGRRSMAMGAISGIDIALWDLRGKAAHKPVSALLGAVRDRIPSYASGGFYAAGKEVDGLRRELEGYMRRGYTDAKIKIGRNLDRPGPLHYMADPCDAVTVEEDWRRIEAAEQIVGDGHLMVDTNASWDAETALKNIPELARRGVVWLEEPIPFEDLAGFTALCAAARRTGTLQIIGCETQQVTANFETMLRAEALDIAQADVGWAGGISEIVRIAAAAQAHGKKTGLHCFGSAVLFAASLQAAAALPELEPLESEENPNPLKTDLTTEPFAADDHMAWYVPQGDGLGITLDEEKLQKYLVQA